MDGGRNRSGRAGASAVPLDCFHINYKSHSPEPVNLLSIFMAGPVVVVAATAAGVVTFDVEDIDGEDSIISCLNATIDTHPRGRTGVLLI